MLSRIVLGMELLLLLALLSLAAGAMCLYIVADELSAAAQRRWRSWCKSRC